MVNWFDVGVIAVLNGLAIGLLLFVVAVGLSLVFGMMDVLNLAHGALFLTGAYVAWFLAGDTPTWTGWVAALAMAAAVGAFAGGGLSLLDARLIRAGVFIAGSVLATTAGVLASPIYDARPGLDSTILILALVVVVIGGLGSVRGR